MNGRASALTDMPPGLDEYQQKAYIRGYAKAACRYVKKFGAPSTDEAPPVREEGETAKKYAARRAIFVLNLRNMAIEHEWQRHPTCHKAGMTELRRWNRKYPPIELRLAS